MKKAEQVLVTVTALTSLGLAFLTATSLRGFLIDHFGMTKILAQLLSIAGAFASVFLVFLIFYKIRYKKFYKGENHDN